MLTLQKPSNDSLFIKGRGAGFKPMQSESLFSVWMNDESVADEIWLVVIKSADTFQAAYAEVLKSSTNEQSIEEFFANNIEGWTLISVERKIWEYDF